MLDAAAVDVDAIPTNDPDVRPFPLIVSARPVVAEFALIIAAVPVVVTSSICKPFPV